MKTALIDADVLVYACGLATETPIQWSHDLWTLHAHLDDAIEHLDAAVQEIKVKTEADAVVMALSDYNDPWRQKVLPTYKAHRRKLGARKPVVHGPLRQYIHEVYKTYQRPGLEGDDVLGILLTHPSIIEGEKLIVSIDKDMKTLPGSRVDYYRAKGQDDWWPFVQHSSLADADYHHMLQTLTGDATDGYSGCPGCGPVSAKKVLAPFFHECAKDAEAFFDVPGAWAAVVEQYTRKGLSEDVAFQNARVARICRHEDYDFVKKEVRLWVAPVT